jgi:nucleoside-diphosphate-sugar epimerase
MRIYITGAAGFLGSHICESLLKKGHIVYGIDNFFRGKEENLPKHSNFSFSNIDLLDIDNLEKNINLFKPDIVIHYAAINGTRYFYDIPYRVCDENIRLTQNILNVCGNSVKLFVFASSSEVYGPTPAIPTKESEPIILHQASDRDSYASSKAIGEFLTRLWAKEKQKNFLILRPFNTYGSRMATNGYGQVIPEFFERILSEEQFYLYGNGNQTRSFCNVIDHADIVTDLIELAKNETLNIGNEEEITIYELAEKIHFLFDKPFNPIFKTEWDNDTKWRKPDLDNLKKYIGEKKFINLSDGLKKLKCDLFI